MLFQRHWVIICAGFVVGAVLAKTEWITWVSFSVLCSIYIFFLFVSSQKKIRYSESIGIGFLFILVGSFAYLLNPYPDEGDDFFLYLRQKQPNTYVEVEGYVTENTLFEPSDKHIRFVLHISKVKNGNVWEEIKGKALVLCYDAQSPIYTYSRIRLKGKTSLYLSVVNESLRSYESYLRSKRIYSKIITSTSQIEILSTYTFFPHFQISRIQQYLYERFIRYNPVSIRDMARAIWLGDRSGLDYEEKQNFILTGTAHVLAISGLHIGLVFWFARTIAGTLLKSRKRLPDIFALLVCVFYAFVSGAHGSSLRAILMLLIYEFYVFVKRNEDLLSALCLTATLLFVFNTDLIWDMGTQMSILAVASIILFHKPILNLLRFMPWILRSYLSVAISTHILLLPILVLINPQINLLSPLYNLFVVPLVALYLMMSILGLALIFVPFVPALFFYSSGLFLIVIRSLCHWGASFPYTLFSIPHSSILIIVFYFFTCFLLYRWLTIQRKKEFTAFIVSCIILCFMWAGVPFFQKTMVYVLDVGHGDAILIKTAEGENILMDAGTRDMGKWIVVPFLRAHGVRKLDYVIASHADEDHIGGFFPVVDNIPIKKFIYGEGFINVELGKEMFQKITTKKITVVKAESGKQINLKKGSMNIVYAGRNYYNETNKNSLVVKFIYNSFSILLPGDFPAELTKKELSLTDCSAKVIKIPHHGLKNSLNQELLEKTNPEIAVVSVNEFHHNWGVRNEIKELLYQHQIPLWRTDYYGGITIKYNGSNIFLYGAREQNGYLLREDVQ